MEETDQPDERILLGILPEVAWKIVLENLKETTHLTSCTQSSHFFRNRLLSKRTAFLFPEVFGCLAKKYDKCIDDAYKDAPQVDDTDEDIENAIQVDDDYEDIWKYPGNFRLVCSKWNKTVENYYQANLDERYLLRKPTGRCQGYFDSRVDCLEFMDHFQESHVSELGESRGNPFLQRAAQIEIHTGNIENIQEALAMLTTFGKELWNLALEIHNGHDTMVEFYMFLVQLLESVPNLKSLRIWYDTDHTYPVRFRRQLNQAIRTQPPPQFANLTKLVIFHLPKQIFDVIFNKHLEITQLEISSCCNEFHVQNYDPFSVRHPKIHDFSIALNDKKMLRKLTRFGKNWSLKSFDCDMVYDITAEELRTIFLIATKSWPTTLEEFKLALPMTWDTPSDYVFGPTLNFRLNLPKLKFIQVSAPTSLSLDFLLPNFETLERIHLHFRHIGNEHQKYDESKGQQIVEFLGFEDNLGASNIWNLFPKLEWVRVLNRKFYRCSTQAVDCNI